MEAWVLQRSLYPKMKCRYRGERRVSWRGAAGAKAEVECWDWGWKEASLGGQI